MTKDEIKSLVVDYAYGAGIDPSVALAQINQESGFNPNAVSSKGARGLAQFIEGTWRGYSQESFDKAFDPNYSLTAWSYLMKELLDKYGYDCSGYWLALAEYHGGANRESWGPITKNYADTVLANSKVFMIPCEAGDYGQSPFTNTIAGQPDSRPESQESQLITYILIGAAILGALVLFRN